MDTEKEIHSLAAETLALSIIVGNVLSKLAKNPSLRPAVIEGFNQAADVADSVAIQFGKSPLLSTRSKLCGLLKKCGRWFLVKRGSRRILFEREDFRARCRSRDGQPINCNWS
jgi:hypothetical protein